MRKLDKLIIRSFVGPFILTFLISLFILLMQFLWKYIDDLVGKRSPTRAEIDNTLREIQKAARSVRLLADYLEQHPEALLKGKGSGKY